MFSSNGFCLLMNEGNIHSNQEKGTNMRNNTEEYKINNKNHFLI